MLLDDNDLIARLCSNNELSCTTKYKEELRKFFNIEEILHKTHNFKVEQIEARYV